MSIPCDKTFLLVPRQVQDHPVKDEYQGQNFDKIAIEGVLVVLSQTHLVFMPRIERPGAYCFTSVRSSVCQHKCNMKT